MAFKVKITNVGFPHAWYESQRGQEFQCQNFDERFYRVLLSTKIILKEDCDIVG